MSQGLRYRTVLSALCPLWRKKLEEAKNSNFPLFAY
jgi:hypothetical protein